MKTVFVATAILTASFSALGDGEPAGMTRAQVLQEAAGPIVSGELGYSHEAPASPALSRSSAVTSTMGATAAESPQEARLPRTKVRAELDAAVYKGQLGSGEFGTAPTPGSGGSQTLGR
jgi:hypothetical protein